MRAALRNSFLIASTPAIEAWRRREIYAIVIVTTLLLVALRFVHFFEIEGLGKFYRDIGLRVMNVTAAATVILLAARQLPREFADRTIYPLLAKPVRRGEFLIGRFFGVWAAGAFCYGLFMLVFLFASATLDAPMNAALFLQSVYLQLLALGLVAALVFLLSMLLNADAAMTIAAILYLASQILMNLMSYIYDGLPPVSRGVLVVLHFLIPQLTLFDASSRVIHSISDGRLVWGPLPAGVVGALTAYGTAYILVFLGGAYLLFRRRPL